MDGRLSNPPGRTRHFSSASNRDRLVKIMRSHSGRIDGSYNLDCSADLKLHYAAEADQLSIRAGVISDDKSASPIKGNVKRKIFPSGSIPPHSCLGIQPTV